METEGANWGTSVTLISSSFSTLLLSTEATSELFKSSLLLLKILTVIVSKKAQGSKILNKKPRYLLKRFLKMVIKGLENTEQVTSVSKDYQGGG